MRATSPFLVFRAWLALGWLLISVFGVSDLSSANTVTINADGVLVIDGRKMLPIGFTMPPPPEGKTPTGKNAIAELRDAGATFLRTGPMGTDWDAAAFKREQQYQDAAARYGMHCLVNLREAARFPSGDTAHESLLRKLIARFKDHPGMGVWKHVDEPEWGKTPIPDMLRATQILRTLDPHHPIEVTQAPRGTVETLRPYNVTTDIVAADIYPIGYPPGTHSLLSNKEISMVGDYTRTMREVANGKLPVWMTLQIAWSGVVKPGKTLRFPTFAQERFMTYQALINGARGLLFFGGHLTAACTPEDAARGWNWHFWDTVLRPVVQEIGTRSPLYPALLAPDSRLPISVSGATGVEFCVREVGDSVFVLACKREGATEEATFQGFPADCGNGEVLYESPRRVTAKAGVFTDWFAPFDVHVYRFRRAKSVKTGEGHAISALQRLDSSPEPPPPLPPSPRNLALNAGLEGPTQTKGTTTTRGLPYSWESLTIGAPARFAIDTSVSHDGKQSVRITATETTRAYLCSRDPIPVAPGERIHIRAWVRCRDVPVGQGTVIAIAEFSGLNGTPVSEPLAKVGVASNAARAGTVEWEPIESIVTVPAQAAYLRLRMGFSYSRGTCWWDDVRVEAEKPLVLRINQDRAGTRLSPATPYLDVSLINRMPRAGRVRVRISSPQLAKPQTTEVVLSSLAEQGTPVAFPLPPGHRGKGTATATLLEPNDDTPIFSDTRNFVVPPPLVISPPSPTHGVSEDGAPTIDVTVDVAVSQQEMKNKHLVVALRHPDGTLIRDTTQIPYTGPPVVDGLNHRALPLRDRLPVGDYQVTAELRSVLKEEQTTPPLQARPQPWHVIPRRQCEVTLNAHGYLEQDGKVIFPLGVFNGGARMAEMGAAGFTVTQAYNALRVEPNDPRPGDQRAMDFLDTTEKAGMKALFMVPMKLAIAGDWEGFRQRIRRFRNHPALLAWEEEEGLARGDMTPETLAKIRALLQKEDPHHPFMVGDARDVIGRVPNRADFFPLAQMDLGMWWWYPLPVAAQRSAGNALEGNDAGGTRQAAAGELVPPTFLVERRTDKPLWVGVQMYKKPGAGQRYPTPAEYRAQAYIALIHGAKGLMWYGGSVTGGLYAAPAEGHWEDVKSLVRELRDLAPVFLSPVAAAPEAPTFQPANAPISIALKHRGNRHVLFVVNRAATKTGLLIDLPPPVRAAASASVLHENRTVPITNGKITDSFDAYAVHVYELIGASPSQK